MIGGKLYLSFNENIFSMSFIVAFSRANLYGIICVRGKINSLIFGLLKNNSMMSLIQMFLKSMTEECL